MSALEFAVQCYQAIPQVIAIYHDDQTMWVFTSNTVYDDKLMDELINVELHVDARLDQFVDYMPLILCGGQPEGVVSKQAICDYQRAIA